MKNAPIFERFIALCIDMMIVSFSSVIVLIVAFIGYGVGVDRLTLPGLSAIFLFSLVVASFIFLFYFTYLTMDEGMTVGKMVFGIRVIRRDGMGVGVKPGFFRSLVRTMSYVISASVWFLGFFMAFFLKGRTFHDIIAGTQVISIEEDL
ncbi:MAG: hypothetical protein C0392_02170 [Syntrophus sp. (in: bacteria)]|nr:hypothetical protein [Syntrophus sp. (in: bacteria)]